MSKSFALYGTAVADALNHWVEQHPRRLSAAIAALLLGGAGGAFAVATLAPDPALLPEHEIVESVSAIDLDAVVVSGGALEPLYRTDQTRATDTVDTLLKRLGVDDAVAADFLRRDPLLRKHVLGRSGRWISVQTTDRHSLQSLTARWVSDESGQFQRLVIRSGPSGLSSVLESAPLKASTRLASGIIQSSLFAATDAAGLPDSIASQLAEIFSGDIDFRRALRKGDRFSLTYEVLEADGEPLRTGRVLSAEFVNAGKTYQAVWFADPAQSSTDGAVAKGGYYTPDGTSLRRAFLSSPVAFSRVSSGFSMRFHPILKNWRAHLGTDFAAPKGTPARAVGDGTVAFAGWQNGFGNVVFVQHRNNTETVYAHLSKLMVNRGQRVSQGETIGLVGATGWATGPHLHFEVRVNGAQQDPMLMARRSESIPLNPARMASFKVAAQQAQVDLAAAATLTTPNFE
ncbi:MAG: peptidoglycan DD-metalloendopeptidase family protein [Rhodoferax sp.]